jgi:DNA topoisomerase III
MRTVIVAEKKSVAEDLVKALLNSRAETHDGFFSSGDVAITYCSGHLVGLAEPGEYPRKGWLSWQFDSLPLIPQDLEFVYKPVNERAAKQLGVIKKLTRESDLIVNACDAGREGELIFWYALRWCGWGKGRKPGVPGDKPVKRMWYDSMTPEALRAAYQQMRPISDSQFRGLAEAAYTRSEADWILGMNATRAASLSLPKQQEDFAVKVWSVGRVQTPVLAEIVNRDRKIETFVSVPFWGVQVTFGRGELYQGNLKVPEGRASLGDSKDRFAKKEDAEWYAQLISKSQALEWKAEEEAQPVKERPPRLFSLTSLQRYCIKKFGWTAQQVLELAQECYEKEKTLTYPRTESEYLPDDYAETAENVFKTVVREVAGNLEGHQELISPKRTKQKVFDSSKVSDHFAIVPTGAISKQKESNAYRLWEVVVKRFVIAFGETAEAENVKRTLRTSIEGEGLQAQAEGKTYSKKGWLELAEALGETSSREKFLPPLADPEISSDAVVKEGKTQPPAPYDEDSLLAMMENVQRILEADDDHGEKELEALKEAVAARGLGTPATRASIIETLIERRYVARERKGKKTILRGTRAGRFLIHRLVAIGVTALTKPILTADWEVRLKDIELGRSGENREKFLGELVEDLKQQIQVFRSTMERQDRVTEALCPVTGKPIIDKGNRYEVAGYPGGRFPKQILGQNFTEHDILNILAGKSPIFSFKGKTKAFESKMKWDPENKQITFDFDIGPQSLQVKCPKTGEQVIDRGAWFEFAGWPEVKCWKKFLDRKMTPEEYAQIFAAYLDGTEASPELRGFYSQKKKKRFDARISFDGEQFKLVFG